MMLEAGILVYEVQWHGKHVSAAMNEHATMEELLEAVFNGS
jgi:hypothetical protein